MRCFSFNFIISILLFGFGNCLCLGKLRKISRFMGVVRKLFFRIVPIEKESKPYHIFQKNLTIPLHEHFQRTHNRIILSIIALMIL